MASTRKKLGESRNNQEIEETESRQSLKEKEAMRWKENSQDDLDDEVTKSKEGTTMKGGRSRIETVSLVDEGETKSTKGESSANDAMKWS